MTDDSPKTPETNSASTDGWDAVGDSVASVGRSTTEPASVPAGTSNAGAGAGLEVGGGADADTASEEVEIAMVTMVFDCTEVEMLLGVLSKYVVLSRMQAGCRNIDVGASTTVPGRFVVVEKWESMAAQQAHFDSAAMVEMAEACRGLLSKAPTIDLIEPISVHDLA